MKISVVVPAYNEEKLLRACLKSITSQSDKPDEIIVVDNNSTDDTAKIASSFKEVTLIKEPIQGITPTRNKGFDSATGDIIARTDADSKVPKNWIKKIKRDFEKYPDVLAISGTSRFEKIPKVVQPYNWTVTALNMAFKQAVNHDLLYGPNLAIRKSAWEQIRQELCTDDKIVHEDIDLALHIAKHGKIFFDEKLVVVSSPRRWQKLLPYFEYPYRFVRTIQHHRASLKGFKKSSDMMKKVLPRTRQLLKKVGDSLSI